MKIHLITHGLPGYFPKYALKLLIKSISSQKLNILIVFTNINENYILIKKCNMLKPNASLVLLFSQHFLCSVNVSVHCTMRKEGCKCSRCLREYASLFDREESIFQNNRVSYV